MEESFDKMSEEQGANETNLEEAEFSATSLVEELFETQLQVFLTYKCRLCPFSARLKEDFRQHLNKSHLKNSTDVLIGSGDENKDADGKMVYMCGSCSKGFALFSDCRVHMALTHKITINSQSALRGADLKDDVDYLIREKLNGNVTVIKKGKKKLKLINKIPCPISGCLVTLDTQELLEKHKECHVQDSPRLFSCSSCQEVFKKWDLCMNHLWKVHNEDINLLNCHMCKYKTAFKEHLREHIKIHKDHKDFVCSTCGTAFKQKTQLRNHCVLHLKNSGKTDQIPNWIKRKECEQCKKTFCDSKALKKHIQAVHSKLKPYVCQVCGHSSATKSMLRIHSRQHSGEKPFSCNHCSFKTGDHNTLRRHVMRHNGIKPYRCPHCEYSAIQTASLKTHLQRFHPGLSGMFSCPKCPFTTVSKEAFNYHKHDGTGSDKEEEDEEKSTLIYLPYKGDSSNGQGEFIAINFTNIVNEVDESNQCYESAPLDLGGITIPAECTDSNI